MAVAQSSSTPAKTGTGTDGTVRSRRTYSRRRRRHHDDHSGSYRVLQVVSVLLATALAATIIGWVDTWVDLQAEQKEHFGTAGKLRAHTIAVTQLEKEVTQLRKEIQDLVQQRIPGLAELRYDTTLPVNDRYVKNVSFTRTGVDQQKKYEYRLVAENLSDDTITPQVQIFLFDQLGIQVGATKITNEDATSNWTVDFLEIGETRAYSALIPLTNHSVPEYFLVKID